MKQALLTAPMVAAGTTLAGCQFIGDVFKAGVWVGVLIVILVIAGVIWLFTRA